MAQDFVSTIPGITTNILQDNIDGRNNEITLRSNFSGTSFPDNPVIGQKCYREDTKVEWQYNGETWEETGSNSTVSKDVKLCYGDMSSLYDRLAVSLNDDGTLKDDVVVNISEWITTALTPTYVSANSFTVTDDQTGVFTANRAIKGVLSASVVYSFVASSTYDSIADVTTVTLVDSVLASDLSAVQYGVMQESGVARGITNIPSGSITATDVQGAINELDSRQNELDSRQNELDSRQNELDSRQNELDSRQNELDSRQNELDSRQLFRQNSTAYAVGDIAYSPNLPSYAYAECTVAGTTAAAEPTWPAVDQTVMDGTVTWKVKDIRIAYTVDNAILATSAEAIAGTNNAKPITPATLRSGLNAAGNAPVYACRAWVNFSGVDPIEIRASGNVSSIIDLGVGLFRIMFVTPMPDAGFAAHVTTNATRANSLMSVTTYDPYYVDLWLAEEGHFADFPLISVTIIR